ncbi:MAG: hypothetical protein H5T41_00310 [Methanomassiliicoccales archaeon]|nr:hypothetical protein [Methanomassiliicoccales archaeon]
MLIKLRPAAETSDDRCTNTRLNCAINIDSEIRARQLGIKISTVRDYRDYYVLSILQREAVRECPGFRKLEDGERAKIIWIQSEKRWIPAGYYIFSRRCIKQVRHSERPVIYPLTLHQIFVMPTYRGLGLGTMMLRDFIAQGNRRTVWIESPFDVTKHILTKLGYAETNEPYKLWQMMEGLSKWEKISSRSAKKMAMTGETIDVENHRLDRSREECAIANT